MSTLLAIPALVKVGFVFAVILFANRFKVQLGLALLIGAAAMGLSMGMSVSHTLSAIFFSVISSKSLSLAVLIGVILILSKLMADTGQLDRIVATFTRVVGNAKVVSVVMPALIGVLPMPGGALFSAPMVDSACREVSVGPEHKTSINYWFRHIWEYWWPLYPGVILAVSLLHVATWKFILFQIPLTIVAVSSGIFFILRKVKTDAPIRNENETGHTKPWSKFLKEAQPIVLVILAIPAVSLFQAFIRFNLPPLTPVFVGLALALGSVLYQNQVPLLQIKKAALSKTILPMILIIFGIMAFQGLLVESKAVAAIQSDLTRYGIPPLLVILFMPFFSGLVTGIAVGFVGASFPLIIPLFHATGQLDYLAYASLAYAFGFMGMMLSPVHLCFLVTKDYFSASMLKSYRYIFAPILAVMIFALAMFGVIKMLT